MAFSDLLWDTIEPTYRQMESHPFNTELGEGELQPERFRFFLAQYSLMLNKSFRAVSLAASKAPDEKWLIRYPDLALKSLSRMRDFLDSHKKQFKVQSVVKPAMAWDGYGNYQLVTAALQSYEEATAALLPLFWFQLKNAQNQQKISPKDNPYQSWIDFLVHPEMEEWSFRLTELLDQAAAATTAATRTRMKEAISHSAKYELLLSDMAYMQWEW